MKVASHIAELMRKHAELSRDVERAQRSPAADFLAIAQMKKQKLKLKDEIFRLTQRNQLASQAA